MAHMTHQQRNTFYLFIFFTGIINNNYGAWPSALTVRTREGGAFQDSEVVLDFIGVPAKAVEKVVAVQRIHISASVEGQVRGRSQALGGVVSHRVAEHAQQLHLRRTIPTVSSSFTLLTLPPNQEQVLIEMCVCVCLLCIERDI